MSDPVPSIAEADAMGEIAEIYGDIRRVFRVEVVNLVWRHLAIFPGALAWIWTMLRPLYVDGTFAREAAALRAGLVLPQGQLILAEALTVAGLTRSDLAGIKAVLAAYDRTNAMALVALTAAESRLDGATPATPIGCMAAPSPPRKAVPELPLPSLLSLDEMSPATAELVLKMNRFGTRRDDPILATMYRHLAHWPSYLERALVVLEPLDGDGRLGAAVADAEAIARARSAVLAARLPQPRAMLQPAMRTDISDVLGRFTGDVIARMVVICAVLRKASGP